MAELGELLGALMSSLAHARRIADEETASIAVHYGQHPLLQGMSMPRVRVPELRLSLPVVLESFEEAGENEFATPAEISKQMLERLRKSADEEKVKIPEGFEQLFSRHLVKQLSGISSGARPHPEAVVRANEIAFSNALRRFPGEQWLGPDDRREIMSDLRQEAESVAMRKRGKPPRIEATITTSEVKERAASENVPRLQIILREEGVEWSVSEARDGSKMRTIVPE